MSTPSDAEAASPYDPAEPDDVRATRGSYDAVAGAYALALADELAAKPLDRAFLGAFAEEVLAAGGGTVADLGCGPGHITAHLGSLGLDVFGVDLSPEMAAAARRGYPGLRFEVGSMAALGLPAEGLAGIVAWYSIIHTPPERLPALFAEFRRVLRPGGRLILAFQAGDERVRVERAYGREVCLDAYRLRPERIADLLGRAGLPVGARALGEPRGSEKTAQAYLMAARPAEEDGIATTS